MAGRHYDSKYSQHPTTVNVLSCSLMEMVGFKLVTYHGKIQSFYEDELVSEAFRNLDGLLYLQVAKSSQFFVSLDD
jgi:hypothetical protein